MEYSDKSYFGGEKLKSILKEWEYESSYREIMKTLKATKIIKMDKRKRSRLYFILGSTLLFILGFLSFIR